MRTIRALLYLSIIIFFAQCNNQPESPKKDVTKTVTKPVKKRTGPATIGYHFEQYKAWKKTNPDGKIQSIVFAVNRTDSNRIKRMDSVIVPNDVTGDIEFYLPFPVSVPYLKDVNKLIIFSYPAQAFAAYENGELAYTGPSSMGSKLHPTPANLYYGNWKAEKTTSTFNDEWDLKWNFNIENKEGIGFHEYEMPGYPASHSCLRMQEKDAKFMYTWAEQWMLDPKDENKVLAKGTPVIVYGTYNYDGPKPWLQLVNDPKVLNISAAAIEQQVKPYLQDILTQQQNRVMVAEK